MKIKTISSLILFYFHLPLFGQITLMTEDTWISYSEEERFPELTYEETMSGTDFDRVHEFDEKQARLFHGLLEKYRIRDYGFDSETIDKLGDLTVVIRSVLDSLVPGLDYHAYPEVLNTERNLYEFAISKQGEKFHFSTSSLSDYIYIDHNLKELNRIAGKFYPGFSFKIPHFPGDQTLVILFAENKTYEQAVNEGFPCYVPTSFWTNFHWEKGIYTIVNLPQFPEENAMDLAYLNYLDSLRQKGFIVPPMNRNRLTVIDRGDNGLIHVVVDGGSQSLNLRRANKIQCDNSPWGVLLAYTLVKGFAGIPQLDDVFNKKRKYLDASTFLQLVEDSMEKE